MKKPIQMINNIISSNTGHPNAHVIDTENFDVLENIRSASETAANNSNQHL